MKITIPSTTPTSTISFLEKNTTDLYFSMAFATNIRLPSHVLNIDGLQAELTRLNEIIARNDSKGVYSPEELLKKQMQTQQTLQYNLKMLQDTQTPAENLKASKSLLTSISKDINDETLLATIIENYEVTMLPVHQETNLSTKIIMLQKLSNQIKNTEGLVEQLLNGPIVLKSKEVDRTNIMGSATGPIAKLVENTTGNNRNLF